MNKTHKDCVFFKAFYDKCSDLSIKFSTAISYKMQQSIHSKKIYFLKYIQKIITL